MDAIIICHQLLENGWISVRLLLLQHRAIRWGCSYYYLGPRSYPGMRPLVLSTRVAVIRLNRHRRSRTIILLCTEVPAWGTHTLLLFLFCSSLGDPFPPFILILLRTEVGTSLVDSFPPFILILSIHCLVLFGGHLPSFWALIASSYYSAAYRSTSLLRIRNTSSAMTSSWPPTFLPLLVEAVYLAPVVVHWVPLSPLSAVVNLPRWPNYTTIFHRRSSCLHSYISFKTR